MASLLWGQSLMFVVDAQYTISRWRHRMETLVSALLALYAGNSPVTGEFPSQRPMTRSFDVFFDLRLNQRLKKTIVTPVTWDTIALIMTLLYIMILCVSWIEYNLPCKNSCPWCWRVRHVEALVRCPRRPDSRPGPVETGNVDLTSLDEATIL